MRECKMFLLYFFLRIILMQAYRALGATSACSFVVKTV